MDNWLKNLKVGDKEALTSGAFDNLYVVVVERRTEDHVWVKGREKKFDAVHGVEVGKRGKWDTVPMIIELTPERLEHIRKANNLRRCENTVWKNVPPEVVAQIAGILAKSYK